MPFMMLPMTDVVSFGIECGLPLVKLSPWPLSAGCTVGKKGWKKRKIDCKN